MNSALTTRRVLFVALTLIGTIALGWISGRIIGVELANAELGFGERVKDGPWRFSDRVGRPEASLLERARLAVSGPLGLSASEAIYFVSRVDGSGKPLFSQCEYVVSGGSLDARWWSLTVYDAETFDYVIDHRGRASWNSLALPGDSDNPWRISLSSNRRPDPWIPTPLAPGKQLELLFRIYNPSENLRGRLPNIELPSIERMEC